jgi:hypothetical protein
MYDFLTADLEDWAAECERQRRILANLPRNSTSATYLLHRATALYDVQVRLEDAAIAMKDVPANTAHAAGCKTGIKHIANAIPQLTSEIGHLTLAARYDMDCVSEAADLDVEVLGVPLSVQKAARALHKQKEDAIKKAGEEQARLQTRRRMQANTNAMALQQQQHQPSTAPPPPAWAVPLSRDRCKRTTVRATPVTPAVSADTGRLKVSAAQKTCELTPPSWPCTPHPPPRRICRLSLRPRALQAGTFKGIYLAIVFITIIIILLLFIGGHAGTQS